MPRVVAEQTRTDKETGEKKVIATRLMLQPSKFPLIKSYELAQDSVGEWFKEIGLVRGERRIQAIRDAMDEGKEPPRKRFHVTPRVFRLLRERKLARAEKALAAEQKAVETRGAEAEAILTLAAAVAEAAVDLERSEPGALVAPKGADNDKPEAFDAAREAAKASPTGAARVLGAFKAGWTRLRRRAREEALAEAEAEFKLVTRAMSEAGDLIRDVKSAIPESERGRLGEARSKFAELADALKRGFVRGRLSYERNVLGAEEKESRDTNGLPDSR